MEQTRAMNINNDGRRVRNCAIGVFACRLFLTFVAVFVRSVEPLQALASSSFILRQSVAVVFSTAVVFLADVAASHVDGESESTGYDAFLAPSLGVFVFAGFWLRFLCWSFLFSSNGRASDDDLGDDVG